MKRSVQVTAPLLAAAALAIVSGCRRPEMKRCVDAQNHVVDDHFCAAQGPLVPPPQGVGGPYVPVVPMYRFYYGGLGGYSPGAVVSGGTFTALSGHSYSSPSSSTTRGGFGSTHGGGDSSGGEAGGHGGGSGE